MKHFILPIALGLALVSCNRDNGGEGNLPAETPILPVKILGGGDGDLEFKYNGDKLSEIITKYGNSIERNVVEYTGDLITSFTNYNGDTQVSKTTFKYENGKLVEAKEVGEENGKSFTYVTTYQHSGNTITEVTNNGRNDYDRFTNTIQNGNLVKAVGDGVSYTYKYDEKNSPLKNVKGISALAIRLEELGNMNNMLEEEEVIERGSGIRKTTYTYDYNTNNFPTKQVKTKEGEAKTYTTTYTYNK